MIKWHKFPDELPKDATWNLFKIDEDPDIATPPAIVAFFEDGEVVGLRFFGLKEHQITHWMPLPDLPRYEPEIDK